MARNRITKRDIDALRCKAGQERAFLWDGEERGFGVVGFRSGKKVFIAQYRLNGDSHRTNIGNYGTLLLDDTKGPDGKPIYGARTIARDMLTAAKKGEDPLKTRRDKAAVRTFRDVGDEFLSLHLSKKKHNTRESYRQVLERHVYPAIGSRRMDSITKADVMRLHSKLSEFPYAANRCLSVISAVWNWAAERGERAVTTQNNPAKVKRSARYAEQSKERFLSPDELGSLGDALRRAETIGLPWTVDETNPKAKHARKNRIRLIDKHAVAAIRLLILTGARLREILHAKWDDVKFDRGVIELPDSKTGKKTLFLSAAALALLNAIPRIKGNPYIIPGESRPINGKKPEPAPRADLKRPWAAVSKAAKLSNVRIHDLRHSFASMGAGASLGLPIIGKLLGHTQAATTARYSHLDADPLRRAADVIGNQISAAMAGNSAEVIELKPGQAKAR